MKFLVSLCFVLTLAVANAAPVAGATVSGHGAYAVLSIAGGGKGAAIGLVFDTSGGDSRLLMGATGLLASAEYSIVGRSIGCDGTPSASNRTFGVRATADANGTLSVSRNVGPVDDPFFVSLWLTRNTPTAEALCGLTVTFDKVATGDVTGDGALGFHIHINPFQFALGLVE